MSLSTAESFAASLVLTEWPDTMTYDELCDGIKFGHEDVIVYEQFEDELPDDIIETIESIRFGFIKTVAGMTENLREAIRNGDPMTIAEQLQALESKLGVN